MNYEDWEPIYESIVAEFGYDRATDERARDILVELLEPEVMASVPPVDASHKTVAIAGGASRLADELDRVISADLVFAASNAAAMLLERDVGVDVMVTDLDKCPAVARRLAANGAIVAIHAHGDNIEQLRTHVPEIGAAVAVDASDSAGGIFPTTQVKPSNPPYNVGGFTDGDRAAYLADSCGAQRLVFAGWYFDDPTVSDEKRRKLQWARRLLERLERVRGESFDLPV